MAGERKAVSPAMQVRIEQPYAVTCPWCRREAEASSGQSVFSEPSVLPSCCWGQGGGGGGRGGAPSSALALLCFRVKKGKRNLPWCFFLLKINFYQ